MVKLLLLFLLTTIPFNLIELALPGLLHLLRLLSNLIVLIPIPIHSRHRPLLLIKLLIEFLHGLILTHEFVIIIQQFAVLLIVVDGL